MNTRARPTPLRLVVLALAALMLAAAAASGALAQAENGKLDKLETASVEKTIQIVRQLKLKRNVAVVARTPEQATRMLAAELDREYTPEQIETDGRAGAMIGLYPRGIDLKASNLQLLEAQVIAFYDFHSKRMVVVSGALEREFATEPPEIRTKLGYMILAHEFTHALQDQNFDFGAEDEKLKTNGDRELALHSLAEGDATIAGYAYMLGGMNQAILSTLINNLGNFSQAFTGAVAGVPRGVSEPLIFQYTDGVRFVAQAYQRGGWPAVDKLYANPPQSTQQIIDPALYYEHPLLPETVTVAGYEPRLPEWHKADADTMGELGLRIILQNTLPKNSPDLKLAAKWAGDRVVMLRKSKATGVIWLLAFRDAGSARRFAAVYGKVLDRLHARRRTAHRVEVRGAAVLVIIGEPAAHFEALAAALWKASKITPAPPAAPPSSAPLQAAAPAPPALRLAAANR